MKRLVPALASLALLALPAPARAGGESLVGKEPPSIALDARVKGTLRVSNKLSDHEGKVVLLFFFGDDDASRKEAKRVARVARRHRGEDAAKSPLVVFGITRDVWGEGDRKLDAFDEETGVDFPVLVAPRVVDAYGVKGGPAKFLVGRDRKVVREGAFSACDVDDLVLDPALDKADPPAVSGPEKLAAALALAKEGDYARAFAGLEGLTDEGAKKLAAWIEARGDRTLARADAAVAAGDIYRARDGYAALEKSWPASMACAKEGAARLAALKAGRETKGAFLVEKNWNDALALEKAKDPRKAAEILRKCAKTTAGTAFADRCEERAAVDEAAAK